MLNCKTLITITQVATTDFPTRNKTFTMDFVSEGEITSTWVNLTDTAKLKFPKNIYFRDQNGKPYAWFDQNVIASSTTPPLLLRGDKINIQLGYSSQDENGNETPAELNEEFDGYVTKVKPLMPIEVECEDRMWLLKQVKADNRVYTGVTVQSMIRTMLDADPKTIGIVIPTNNVQVNVGDFRAQNETIAQVLHRLQKDYRVYSYFRKVGTVYELRIGLVYYPAERVQRVYHFQKNIFPDAELEYLRTDDLSIGIKAYSILNNELEVVNEDATRKTKKQRLEVFVGKNGKTLESTFQGEIVTRYYWNVTTEARLVELATADLGKYYYTGLRGSFETFCLPFVKHGDEAVLRNDILKEFNGSYLVKGVTTNFGVNGHHKKVQLHIRIDGIFQDSANGI